MKVPSIQPYSSQNEEGYMLNLEEKLMIHDTSLEVEKEYGKPIISVIAQRTGYDRKTVRKYVKSEALATPRKKREYVSKLDSHKETIVNLLDEYPYLSAVRIFEELQRTGYTGGYTLVKDFVRRIRKTKQPLAIYRFETKPGQQIQTDWGDLGYVEMDGEPRHLYIFTMILGYSRVRFAKCTLSMDFETLVSCHLEAFEYFGGVTKEILYDNMKTVIVKKSLKSEENVFNQHFLDFSKYYGFTPRTCKAYTPKTKGKIENCVKYIKSNFFYGRKFSSYSDLCSQLSQWLDKVNNKVHGTTNEIPIERLKKERAFLKSISSLAPYPIAITETRKVSNDSYISYLGNKYSIPYQYANHEVVLKITKHHFKVFFQTTELCEHELVPGKNRKIKVKEHFEGLLSQTMKENTKRCYSSRPILRFETIKVETPSIESYEKITTESQKS